MVLHLFIPEQKPIWRATCGVCGADYICHPDKGSDPFANPAPHGTFCPECKKQGRNTIGVLNFRATEPRHGEEETDDESVGRARGTEESVQG